MNEERRPARGGAQLPIATEYARTILTDVRTDRAIAASEGRAVEGGRVTAQVAVRDLRDLPFFQVRLDALQAIRDSAPVGSRVRTIGFYAICCQLANEQRHTGEQRRFIANYDELAARARMARKTVRSMLSTLDRAGVLRLELTPDIERGAVITTFHLPIQDGPFAAITVAMAKHLAASHGKVIVTTSRGDLGGYLTRDLGHHRDASGVLRQAVRRQRWSVRAARAS